MNNRFSMWTAGATMALALAGLPYDASAAGGAGGGGGAAGGGGGAAGGGAAGGGGGGAGGGGGGAMQVATQHGLYLVDLPQPGEASVQGFVLASLSGSHATPADTVVTVNGVALMHAPGLAAAWFIVDPQGPQPALGADGLLHIVASSASAKATRALDLACPVRVVVASDPAPGSSLGAAAALDIAWTPLPQNVPLFITGSFSMDPPAAHLFSYDLASGTIGAFVGQSFLGQDATSTSIAVQPSASSGYLAELRYPGVYNLDGNSGGYCGRAQRYTYLQ